MEINRKHELISSLMSDDVVQEVREHVEAVVSAKMGELEGHLSKLLSVSATEACVREEPDSLKALLAGIETRIWEDHEALVDAFNALAEAMNEQTALLGALCGEVKTMSKKIDTLCSHTRCVLSTKGRTLRQSPSPFKALQTGWTLSHPSSRVSRTS